MLPKKHRLPGYKILEVLKKGRKIQSPSFNLFILKPAQTETPTTLTIIIPKKLTKKAVLRNRTKRLFTEAIQVNLEKIPLGLEIILMAKAVFAEEKLQDIMPEVKNKLLEISK